jgi:CheY-like chemotaxis protein
MTESGAGPLHVLLVDDEPFSLSMVQHLMQNLGADHIVTASSFAEARVALATDASLRMIVSDHYMPDGSGLRLLGDLRQGKFAVPNDSYFVVSTSSKSFALAAVAMALDVDSFMTKPYSKDQLALRLYEFLTKETRSIKSTEHYLNLDVDAMLTAAESMDPMSKKGTDKKAPHAPLTPLNKVQFDTPLTQDLVNASGVILLRNGTILSKHILRRLAELGIEGVPITPPRK